MGAARSRACAPGVRISRRAITLTTGVDARYTGLPRSLAKLVIARLAWTGGRMRHIGIVLTCILAIAPTGRAELPKNERNAVKEMLSGSLYLRIDVPCRYGRQPFGVYVDALVEVTPTGSNIEEEST